MKPVKRSTTPDIGTQLKLTSREHKCAVCQYIPHGLHSISANLRKISFEIPFKVESFINLRWKSTTQD